MDVQSIKRHIAVTERLIREEKVKIANHRGNTEILSALRREATILCGIRCKQRGVVTGHMHRDMREYETALGDRATGRGPSQKAA